MRRIALLSAAFIGSFAFVHGPAVSAPLFLPPPIGIVRTADYGSACYASAIVAKPSGHFAYTMRQCLPRDGPRLVPASASGSEGLDGSVVGAVRECAERTQTLDADLDESYIQCIWERVVPLGYMVIAR